MRCPQYARFKPAKRAVGAPCGNAPHTTGKGTVSVVTDFVPIKMATFRQRDLGAGLKGMPRAQAAVIKARRAALTMTLPKGGQRGEAPRVLHTGKVKRDGYLSHDDRHRHYAWKSIKP